MTLSLEWTEPYKNTTGEWYDATIKKKKTLYHVSNSLREKIGNNFKSQQQ